MDGAVVGIPNVGKNWKLRFRVRLVWSEMKVLKYPHYRTDHYPDIFSVSTNVLPCDYFLQCISYMGPLMAFKKSLLMVECIAANSTFVAHFCLPSGQIQREESEGEISDLTTG